MPYRYEGGMDIKRGIWRAHGQGILTYYPECADPGAEAFCYRYEGEFEQGRATGQGTTTYGEQYDDPAFRGWVYQGAHDNGYSHGQGISDRPDRTREYEGQWEYNEQWEEGCWRGHGTLYRRDGHVSREGQWANGGSGEYEWKGVTHWYEGDWDEEGAMPHGWGVLYRHDPADPDPVIEGWWLYGMPSDRRPPGHPEDPHPEDP